MASEAAAASFAERQGAELPPLSAAEKQDYWDAYWALFSMTEEMATLSPQQQEVEKAAVMAAYDADHGRARAEFRRRLGIGHHPTPTAAAAAEAAQE